MILIDFPFCNNENLLEKNCSEGRKIVWEKILVWMENRVKIVLKFSGGEFVENI